MGVTSVILALSLLTHVCFIALIFAGSLAASCSDNFLGTRQMLMHEKTCMIPIIIIAKKGHNSLLSNTLVFA